MLFKKKFPSAKFNLCALGFVVMKVKRSCVGWLIRVTNVRHVSAFVVVLNHN